MVLPFPTSCNCLRQKWQRWCHSPHFPQKDRERSEHKALSPNDYHYTHRRTPRHQDNGLFVRLLSTRVKWLFLSSSRHTQALSLQTPQPHLRRSSSADLHPYHTHTGRLKAFWLFNIRQQHGRTSGGNFRPTWIQYGFVRLTGASCIYKV